MYSAFVLIIPPRLEDIQAASVPWLGFVKRVICGSAGERLQGSPISHVLRRQGEGVGGCSLVPMYGRSGQLLYVGETMSLDMN